MLGKLLKYEIKATGRIFLPLFLALLVFAAITRFISFTGPEKWNTPTMISMAIYIAIMTGMFVMTFIMMIQRFYKNLLSDEGYLTHTLPVKPWKHIVSKLLVSMMWIVASGIAAFISIMIISLRKGDIAELTSFFVTVVNQFFGQLGVPAYIISIELIIVSIIGLASVILIVYTSIAIGHLFSQHKILASFAAFIALNTASQIFLTFVDWITGGAFSANIEITSHNFVYMEQVIILEIAYAILVTGILFTAYFAMTNHILSKRLNLE